MMPLCGRYYNLLIRFREKLSFQHTRGHYTMQPPKLLPHRLLLKLLPQVKNQIT